MAIRAHGVALCAGVAAAIGAGACSLDFEAYDPRISGSSSDAATGSATATSSATGSGGGGAGGSGGAASTGAGAAAGAGPGGAGGAGGAGGVGGMTLCEPGSMVACYTGPPATQDVGACVSGTATCNAQGDGVGPCVGEVLPQPEDCATAADDDCNAAPNDHCALWAKKLGASGDQDGNSVATNSSGHVFLVGEMSGTTDFGGGPLTSAGDNDVFVAKFDGNGSHLWSKVFGDGAVQEGLDVAATATGGAVVAGRFEGTIDFGGGPLTSAGLTDAFVVMFDQAGGHVWSQRFGGAMDDGARSVVTAAGGSVFVTGYFAGSVGFGGVPLVSADLEDVFLVRLDAAGNHNWSEAYGGAGNDAGFALDVDAVSGDLVLFGEFETTIDLGGAILMDAGSDDLFLARLGSAGGAHVWSKAFGTGGDEESWSVDFGPMGNIVIAGLYDSAVSFGGAALVSAGAQDAYVAKLDGAGNHVWSKSFGDPLVQLAAGVTVDGAGNVVVAGAFEGTVDFGGGPLAAAGIQSDIFVVKLDPTGNHVWSRDFGDPGDQEGLAVAVDASDAIFFTGSLAGSTDFGTGVLTVASADDTPLVKLSP